MPAKRKPWWHYLRGPRGHRGLPGPQGISHDYSAAIVELERGVHSLKDVVMLLRERVADLERKLGGSQK